MKDFKEDKTSVQVVLLSFITLVNFKLNLDIRKGCKSCERGGSGGGSGRKGGNHRR